MGPPKKKKPRLAYSVKLARCDYFEYRWSDSTESYYFFNPYTGETIFATDVGHTDRQVSMWALPDTVVEKRACATSLYPESYGSRLWGRRPVPYYTTKRAAATHINAVARGFLARLHLSQYFGARYAKILCEYSGYYYYYDRYNTDPEKDPSWHKPRLAFPWDISVYIPDDPEDYLRGDKYSYRGFEFGPYVLKNGVGEKATVRAETWAFIKPNEWRDSALERPQDIDVDDHPLGDVIPWMDGLQIKDLVISEYVIMKTAIHNNNWKAVFDQMNKYPDNQAIQLYGLFQFSITYVPITEEGVLHLDALIIYNHCLNIISAPNKEYNHKYRFFALNALYNILSTHAGRLEFFNVRHVTLQGEGRQDAIERHQLSMLKKFIRYLERIPTVIEKTSTRGSMEFTDVVVPSKEGVDIVEVVLLNLAVLAHEQETREIMAEVTIDVLLEALIICEFESQVQVNALRYLYNLCYRCESGQACVLQRKPKILIKRIQTNFSGDVSIDTQLRRFELSLKINGWRGNVEEIIEKEMRDEDIESTALKSIKLMTDAEFEAMFSGGAALNDRNIEDDLQSYQTKASSVVGGAGAGGDDNRSMASSCSGYNPEASYGDDDRKSYGGLSGGGLDAKDSFNSAGLQEMSAITHK